MSKPIAPEHVYDLIALSSLSMSPDGKRLAFVRSKADREKNETSSRIMMMSLPEGTSREFTQGGKDAQPRFSPDGGTLAFIREDEKGGKQIWLIPASGGEARRLTDLPGGANNCAWSPDSTRLACVSDVDPDRLPDDHDDKKDARVRVVRRIRYRDDVEGWRGDAFRHLFVVDAGSGETSQLTDGDGDDGGPVWSPDGERIAFFSDGVEARDVSWRNEICVVPSRGGKRETWSPELCRVELVMWSPDGRELLAVGTDDEEIGSGQFGLFIAARHGAPRRITDDDLAVAPHSGTAWSDEGRIVFLADSRGQSYLYSASYDGGSVEKIVGGGVEITELAADADARRGVIAVASPDSAGDLFAVDIEKGSRSRLTHFNEDFFDEHQPGGMEKFAIIRAGLEIESRLVLPPEFDRSSRYPAIVDIHGGPASRFGDTFKIEQQVLATAGYVVLAVNPRGSSSYGDEFMKAVLGDWGGEDYLDIMAAVDELSARPYIDETRLGVTGYSYGGYMTAWIAGHDDRFKAAVVGAPCINLYSMYGTSDIGVHFGEVNWGGSPDQVLDFMLERSPLRYASEVQTPVLLMHGEKDLRCPIAQSEEYFVALKRLKKEVQMVRFPGCSHGFLRTGRPKAREEYLGRMLAWLDKHLQVSEAGAPSAEAH